MKHLHRLLMGILVCAVIVMAACAVIAIGAVFMRHPHVFWFVALSVIVYSVGAGVLEA